MAVFMDEQRLPFTIEIDTYTDKNDMPLTMQEYRLQVTSTTVLIDQRGRIRLQKFGTIDDLTLGVRAGILIGKYQSVNPNEISNT